LVWHLNSRDPKHFPGNIIRVLCLFCLAVIFLPLHAQGQVSATDTVFHLFARVTGRYDHMPVQFAHIINRTTGHGNISDTLGFFTVLVHQGDLISISAIGYFNRSFQVTDTLQTSSHIPVLELTPRSYPIDQVNVNPLGSYQQFRQKVLELKLPEPEHKINPIFVETLERAGDTMNVTGPVSLGSPITAIYDLLSKEGKSKRRLAEIRKQEELERMLSPKYNRQLVGRLTGLEGIELSEFMLFCNFDPGFLLGSTDYMIAEAVLQKLNEWKQRGE